MLTSRVSFMMYFLVLLFNTSFANINNLHDNFDIILKTYVLEGQVDYINLKENRIKLDNYLLKLSDIEKDDFHNWSEEERLAYLINLYNASTLQLIINHYPVKSIKDIGTFFKGPWKQKFIYLFGEKISLDNLEHDIIRKEYNEARIHMALVCAAKGCPILRSEAYTGTKLNSQLIEQVKLFLSSSNGMLIERNSKRVYLSPIFKWYAKDFPSVIEFVEEYSYENLNDFKVYWLDYDWDLNKKE